MPATPTYGSPRRASGSASISGRDQTNPAVESASGASATRSRQPASTRSACSIGYATFSANTAGPSGCRRSSNDVTTPKLPPPPRSAQYRSGCSSRSPGRGGRRPGRLGRDEVVDGHAVASALVRDAAAERQPGHAGLGHDAAGSGEAVWRGHPVHVGPGRAALDVHGATGRVHADVAHGRQVDDDAVLDHRRARDVVPAAPDDSGSPRAAAKRMVVATSSASGSARSAPGACRSWRSRRGGPCRTPGDRGAMTSPARRAASAEASRDGAGWMAMAELLDEGTPAASVPSVR
jgi:hypothetical protein